MNQYSTKSENVSENLKQLISIYGQRRYKLGAAHGTSSNVLTVDALNKIDRALNQQAARIAALEQQNAGLRAALEKVLRHGVQGGDVADHLHTDELYELARQALGGGS